MMVFAGYGRAIRSLRRERRLSQEELALAAGVGHRTVVRVESEQRPPGLEIVDALLVALGVTAGDFVAELKRVQGVAPSQLAPDEAAAAQALAPGAEEDGRLLELVSQSLEVNREMLDTLRRRRGGEDERGGKR